MEEYSKNIQNTRKSLIKFVLELQDKQQNRNAVIHEIDRLIEVVSRETLNEYIQNG